MMIKRLKISGVLIRLEVSNSRDESVVKAMGKACSIITTLEKSEKIIVKGFSSIIE